jgi:hypothetical protein
MRREHSRDLTRYQERACQALSLMRRVEFDALPGSSWPQGFPFPGFPLEVMVHEVMVHEARHIEFGSHTCGTKDNTISELGSFGAQYSLMLWLGTHSRGLSAAERQYALDRADTLRARVFCNECL